MSSTDSDFRCAHCGGNEFGAFVQYGSYVLKCMKCRESAVATSYMAIGPKMQGRIRAVLVDEYLQEQAVVADGEAADIYVAVKKAAGKGGLVWLKSSKEAQDA